MGRYTLKRRGKAQRDRYLAALDRRFRWLAEDPRRGRPRPGIGEGVHSFLEGSHGMFYAARTVLRAAVPAVERRIVAGTPDGLLER